MLCHRPGDVTGWGLHVWGSGCVVTLRRLVSAPGPRVQSAAHWGVAPG